ncbi:MAG TPA: hypothetical protein VFU64_00440 [Gaiellaceae bacterium]|nr:hypothetical protein [Gaiellaceae bacterium]
MALAASPRHDYHVHACSLAQAMAVAARRQRDRARTWSPAPWTSALGVTATPPPRHELAAAPDACALSRAALAQQLEATATRERARAMLAEDHAMRLRLQQLASRAAAGRDRLAPIRRHKAR